MKIEVNAYHLKNHNDVCYASMSFGGKEKWDPVAMWPVYTITRMRANSRNKTSEPLGLSH